MSNDPSDAARRGYRDQVRAAIAIGLNDSSWVEIHIEPREEGQGDDSLQKTDVLWIFADGRKRHDQMKSYTTPVKPGQLNGWATELAEKSKSKQRRVVYSGPLSSTAHGHTPTDADFLHLACSHEDLKRLALTRLQEALIGDRSATYDIIKRALDDLVIALDDESIGGLALTRENFHARIQEHLQRVQEQSNRSTNANLQFGLHRLVLVHVGGLVHEVVRYTVTNYSTEPREVGFEPTWTDSERATLLHGCPLENADDRHYQSDSNPGQLELTLFSKGAIPPGETAAWGLVLRREGIVRRESDIWVFSDPLLPTEYVQTSYVQLIVNRHEQWIDHSPTPLIDGAKLSWEQNTSSRILHLDARWKTAPTAQLAHETDVGLAAIKKACREAGLSDVPELLFAP